MLVEELLSLIYQKIINSALNLSMEILLLKELIWYKLETQMSVPF